MWRVIISSIFSISEFSSGVMAPMPALFDEHGDGLIIPQRGFHLRDDPGRPSLASVREELAKLELIRRIELPTNLHVRIGL
jgi:hypothetical protein